MLSTFLANDANTEVTDSPVLLKTKSSTVLIYILCSNSFGFIFPPILDWFEITLSRTTLCDTVSLELLFCKKLGILL